jgi:DNA-binding NarL/FixJ family response regulator
MIQLPPDFKRIAQLANREYEIFWLVGEGHKTGHIAQALGISPKTVSAHYDHIATKLELHGAHRMRVLAVRFHEWAMEQRVHRICRGFFTTTATLEKAG